MTPTPLHKILALVVFRNSVFFVVAAVAFGQPDPTVRAICTTLVFLIDVATWWMFQAMTMAITSVHNSIWKYILTDRFIFRDAIGAIHSGTRFDHDAIEREALKDAIADINKSLNDNTIWNEWGAGWKALLGAGLFIWYWVRYGIFYLFAYMAGAALRSY